MDDLCKLKKKKIQSAVNKSDSADTSLYKIIVMDGEAWLIIIVGVQVNQQERREEKWSFLISF